jgi:hypothetical protein
MTKLSQSFHILENHLSKKDMDEKYLKIK